MHISTHFTLYNSNYLTAKVKISYFVHGIGFMKSHYMCDLILLSCHQWLPNTKNLKILALASQKISSVDSYKYIKFWTQHWHLRTIVGIWPQFYYHHWITVLPCIVWQTSYVTKMQFLTTGLIHTSWQQLSKFHPAKQLSETYQAFKQE